VRTRRTIPEENVEQLDVLRVVDILAVDGTGLLHRRAVNDPALAALTGTAAE
jgi:hypothetical protein